MSEIDGKMLSLTNDWDQDDREKIVSAQNGTAMAVTANWASFLKHVQASQWAANSKIVNYTRPDDTKVTMSVQDAIMLLRGQLNALVLAPDSTTVNQELTQARTALDGTACETLEERLERDLTLLQQVATAQHAGLMDSHDKARMDNPELGLSPITRVGELAITKLLTHSNAIVQSHYYNSDSNAAYTCQNRTLDGKQQLVFQKHSNNGTYSGEWMVIDWVSHGSAFFVTTENGQDYLWVGIDRAPNADPIFAKIQWSRNVEISYPNALITTYDHFNLDHMPYAVVDKDKDIIAFRFVGTINYFIGLDGNAQYTGDEIVIRKFSDVIAGRDQVLARWAIPDDSKYYPCQGFDIHNDALYWQSGAKNADEQAVSKFDLMTGKVQLRMPLKGLFAQSQAGAGDTASIEPEGLQVVPDHGRGNAMITIGNQVGPWGERRHVVNAFNAEGSLDLLTSWQGNQYDLPHFPDGYGDFNSFWQPGTWYVTQSQMRQLIDGPEQNMSKWVGAAIFINYVMPYGYRRQEIKSVRQSHYSADWHRHSGQFGTWTTTQMMGSTCNGWIRYKKQPVILWKGDLSHAGTVRTSMRQDFRCI
ncbi:phage baseplate protein [Lactiplantibacillus carotarum]|uniref:phage baseplate protein n=1 Tax=Lactiplantibacillus carotarum TaxID=2993456 RepID=UPI00298F0D6E|nr:hypothetical protein [Lactiplantibacillus carotarum]